MSDKRIKVCIPDSVDFPAEVDVYHGKDARCSIPYIRYAKFLEVISAAVQSADGYIRKIQILKEENDRLKEAIDEKRYICTDCGRSFLWPRGNEDPCHCPLCGADIRKEDQKVVEENTSKNTDETVDKSDKCETFEAWKSPAKDLMTQIFDEFDLMYYWEQE